MGSASNTLKTTKHRKALTLKQGCAPPLNPGLPQNKQTYSLPLKLQVRWGRPAVLCFPLACHHGSSFTPASGRTRSILLQARLRRGKMRKTAHCFRKVNNCNCERLSWPCLDHPLVRNNAYHLDLLVLFFLQDALDPLRAGRPSFGLSLGGPLPLLNGLGLSRSWPETTLARHATQGSEGAHFQSQISAQLVSALGGSSGPRNGSGAEQSRISQNK